MPAEVIDSGPQRTVSRYEGAAPPASPCCSSRRSPRPRSASTCGAAARWPSTSCTAGPPHLPARVRRHPVRRPRARARALGRGRHPGGGARRVGRRRRPPRARRRLVPGRDPERCSPTPTTATCRSRPSALVASPWDFSKVPLVAPLRPIAAVTRGHGVTQLYRALGGAPAPLVKRGYQLAGIDKYVMKPWTVALQPRRPRPARPDRGGRRVHGPHARLPRAHLRPALPPLLPHQRPRRRPARARPTRTIDLADVADPAAGDRRPRRRDRAGRRLPPRRPTSCRTPPVAARDGARRPPRRAHRPRGARHDLEAARRVPRTHGALHRAARPERSGYPRRHAPAARRRRRRCCCSRRAPPPRTTGASRPAPRRPASTSAARRCRRRAATLDAAFAAALAPADRGARGRPPHAPRPGRRSASASTRCRTRPARVRRRDRTPPAPDGTTGRRPAARDLRRRQARRVHGLALDRASDIRPRSAQLRMTIRRMKVRRARMGWSIDEKALALALDPLLADPYAVRVVRVERVRVHPKVNVIDLRRQHRAVADDRPRELQAALLQEPQAAAAATGSPSARPASRRRPAASRSTTRRSTRPGARPTSRGPAPTATRSSRAASADNPLKARWMGIVGGVGIHGTAAEYSIGTAASHGCIRMRVADVIDLYPARAGRHGRADPLTWPTLARGPGHGLLVRDRRRDGRPPGGRRLDRLRDRAAPGDACRARGEGLQDARARRRPTRRRARPPSTPSWRPRARSACSSTTPATASPGAVESVPDERVRAQFETNVFAPARPLPAGAAGHARAGLGQDRERFLDGRALHVPGRRPLPRDQVRARGAVGRDAVRAQGLRRRRDPDRAGPHQDRLRRRGSARNRAAPRRPTVRMRTSTRRSARRPSAPTRRGCSPASADRPRRSPRRSRRALGAGRPRARYTVTAVGARRCWRCNAVLPDAGWDAMLRSSFPRPGKR